MPGTPQRRERRRALSWKLTFQRGPCPPANDAVIPQTKCRSAAEARRGEVPVAAPAVAEGGCLPHDAGPRRGSFAPGRRTHTAPGKAGRAGGGVGRGYRRGRPWALSKGFGATSPSQAQRVPEEVAPEPRSAPHPGARAAGEDYSRRGTSCCKGRKAATPREAGASAQECSSLASLSPLCKGSGAPTHPLSDAGRFSGRLLRAGQDTCFMSCRNLPARP